MAAPTVEMGLGGSLRALAATYAPTSYQFSMMRAAPFLFFYTPGDPFGFYTYQPDPIILEGVATSGWLVAPRFIVRDSSTVAYEASVLPEGGTAVICDGVAGYMNTSISDPLLEAASIETVVTISATPGVGVEPAVLGNSSFGLTYKNDGKVHAYYNGSDVLSTTVATGSPVHLVLTRSGAATDSVSLYVNGSATTATPALASLSGGGVSYMGKHWSNAHYLSATYYFMAAYGVELSAANVSANYAATQWTDVTDDTLGARGLVIERGIRDDRPSSRVASTGTCTFSMNNLGSNSGGVNGYYSPGHASVRSGFGKGTPVRVLTGSDVQFIGRVRAISPEPGMRGSASNVLCADFMDTAALFLLEGAPVLEDVTGDYVFLVVLGLMTNQPNGVSVYTGTETYTLALDNTRDEVVSALQEFGRLAVSELGYVYVSRTGGLVYEARGTRITNATTASITLDDTMFGMDVAEVSSSSLNRVQVTVHPRVVDAAATTVLFALANPLQIAAGETKTIIGPYRTASSPGITTRVGGLSMVTPVASTDYTMNVASDGTGVDLTASLDVGANFGANGVQFVLTNNATQPAYITLLQCRGKGVYDFRTVVAKSDDAAAMAADGVNALSLDMVYQEDPNVGQSIADDIRTKYGDLSGTRARMVSVYPDASGSPSGVLTADISDRVAVSETRTGVTGEYYINGVKHEYKNGAANRVSWWLTPAEPVSYWILGVAGASELGSTTIPAPG